MKAIIISLIASAMGFAQSPVTTDLTSMQALLTKTITDATVPAASPDPVLALIKASATIYLDLQTCAGNSTCKVLAVIYGCPRPTSWGSAVSYQFGDFVTDSSGNVYQATLITPPATGSVQSGASVVWNTTAVGATTVDGPYTWTLYALASTAWTCSATSIPALATAAAIP